MTLWALCISGRSSRRSPEFLMKEKGKMRIHEKTVTSSVMDIRY